MGDIELVIKIDEEDYKIMKHNVTIDNPLCPLSQREMVTKIANGIPLQKEYGRLNDADELTEEIKGYIGDTSNLHYDDLEEAEAYSSAYYNCLDEIEDIPTIIEADKE